MQSANWQYTLEFEICFVANGVTVEACTPMRNCMMKSTILRTYSGLQFDWTRSILGYAACRVVRLA
eukprot:IDg20675t1